MEQHVNNKIIENIMIVKEKILNSVNFLAYVGSTVPLNLIYKKKYASC